MYIFMGNKGAIKKGSVQGLKGMEMTERKLIKRTHKIGLLAEMRGRVCCKNGLTYLGHVEPGVFLADVLDDQFPLTGADVLDRNARIVRHYNQVDGLDGFGVGFHPTDLLSSVHRPTIPRAAANTHTDANQKTRQTNKRIKKKEKSY
jgi:hypothetical protein